MYDFKSRVRYSYAALAGKSFPKTNPAHAGAGAAGGLGFAFLTFFHATLESLSLIHIWESASAGIRRIYPDADITIRPLADGGEGTVEALPLRCV